MTPDGFAASIARRVAPDRVLAFFLLGVLPHCTHYRTPNPRKSGNCRSGASMAAEATERPESHLVRSSVKIGT
jgi:hypothetical protein